MNQSVIWFLDLLVFSIWIIAEIKSRFNSSVTIDHPCPPSAIQQNKYVVPNELKTIRFFDGSEMREVDPVRVAIAMVTNENIKSLFNDLKELNDLEADSCFDVKGFEEVVRLCANEMRPILEIPASSNLSDIELFELTVCFLGYWKARQNPFEGPEGVALVEDYLQSQIGKQS
jgi:hypothetical protein